MDNTNAMISIWKSNLPDITHQADSIHDRTATDIMDGIIKFEQKEITEKKNQIVAAVFLTALTALVLYEVRLDTDHFVGIALLIAGVAYNIIANRTDNFPDIRQMNSMDYLKAFYINTMNRSRMHRRNAVMGLFLLVPGCYFTFRDAFPELGFWWIVIMGISAFASGAWWFRQYEKRSKEVLADTRKLIDEFKKQTEDFLTE